MGVSAEDSRFGVPRIDGLRKVDARIRFLSVEPQIEDVGGLDLPDIQWVIVGGESGPGAPGSGAPGSGLESCVNDPDGLSDADDLDAVMLDDREQRLVPGDDELGLGCQGGADDHIVIGIGRDARHG